MGDSYLCSEATVTAFPPTPSPLKMKQTPPE